MSLSKHGAAQIKAMHDEYNAICQMVATCPFDEVKKAWLYACENGMDSTIEETNEYTQYEVRHNVEVFNSLRSLPCALQTAYEHDIRNDHNDWRAAQRANRALLWWRHRGYSY